MFLFGSRARGHCEHSSDLDIGIAGPGPLPGGVSRLVGLRTRRTDAGETPLREGRQARQAFRKPILGIRRQQQAAHAAHEPLIRSEMVAEAPLAGLSFAVDRGGAAVAGRSFVFGRSSA